ncbi:MAG: lysophospholipid acyltransferase family protein [Saprospiraceae bacterium]
MLSRISAFILWLFGWKIEGEYPHDLPRVVLIVVPHTSNWDFPLGILVRTAIKADIRFVGKNSLFKPPFGWLFRSLGGYPVDRKKSTNFVRSMIDIFEREERFHVVLAPEGTRSKVDKLKTGFYFIAQGGKAAIVMCSFDWARKVVAFREPFYPSGDKDADFKIIDDYFRGVKGKCPELGYLYKG